ncbi:hypothetical protein D9615_009572 [Tricholomella constricta]|uniref:Uncharacterized protein n=1 Tax=Tricholomella constricta TaxID=117010 RepID=A0A8H5LWD3_9AGAR|nr:hypothetical protein D9615_009572 [Tricholomella constricta]
MPVTFAVADHAAKPFSVKWRKPSKDQHQILTGLSTSHSPKKIFQSSIDGTQEITVNKNGFVLGALEAYNYHHNLLIRPDDVWIAILSQLNIYINAHAEDLRDKFVAHEGKKELLVRSYAGTIENVDFGDLAVQMTGQLKANVKDESLIPWVLPNFSTTTANDTVVCSILIMSTLKQYFKYTMQVCCGIPSITIEGTQADWQSILDRIDKIPDFGQEPTEWADMLRAILRRFVRAFEAGGPQADKEFWEHMIHEESGSGIYYISGWMSAFCAWDASGVYIASKERRGAGRGFMSESGRHAWVHGLKFDGVWFPRANSCPEGYAEVDVRVIQEPETFDCAMVAGHVGISVSGQDQQDTIHMAPQWFMYLKGD